MYFKYENSLLISGEKVYLPGNIELREDNRLTHNYPIQGWRWFDTEEDAKLFYDIEDEEDDLNEKILTKKHLDEGSLSRLSRIIKDIPANINDEQAVLVVETLLEELAEIHKDDTEYIQKWEPGIGYEINQVVREGGKFYRSIVDNNFSSVFSPTWEETTFKSRGAISTEVVDWVKPDSKLLGYSRGERVRHKNSTWISLVNKNLDEPKSGNLWRKVV